MGEGVNGVWRVMGGGTVGRMAEGRRGEVTVQFCATNITSLFVHPTPHCKLGSEVAKYPLEAKQKRSRRIETCYLKTPLFYLMGEPLENNH